MDYERIYNNLISYRKKNLPECYSEKHHIVPVSLGGTDDDANIVYLTGREHFITHLLLMKFQRCRETIYAAFMMANCKDKNHIGRVPIKKYSRTYQSLRELYAKEVSKIHKGKKLSKETKLKISKAQKGKVVSDKTRQKMSQSAKLLWKDAEKRADLSEKLTGRKFSLEHKENLRKRVFTEEWKKNIGKASQGRKHTSETIRRITAAHIGRKNSPETILKMKAAAKKRWETKRSHESILN